MTMILASGAKGKSDSQFVKRLLEKGFPLRGFTYRSETARVKSRFISTGEPHERNQSRW